ncbi:MAG: carboxylating nicotinate-nucleotide diphosphorylase [Acidimicrobiia bacterium]|nr:carboxylating nicotinate-nucleotide diphosphorylase [Acidimicrobiia bacterium]MDH4307247.1 carboxylating nicotinate-nucleotide diphosphorylase [Acidimicrobiia bacterium]MDH5294314.1 carboxylating nicotinate-nucleotide diphosphorylase [Acidimicrobiia bacterium]
MDLARFDNLIFTCLDEDLAEAGDLTSESVIPAASVSNAEIVARVPGVVAGLGVGARVFEIVDPDVEVEPSFEDGTRVEAGTVLARVHGPSRSVLVAERTALNILGRACGVATATRSLVDAVDGYTVKIADTRKTTPGLRALEKYAVRMGGGWNHRFGLHDTVMIKDNHIVAAGGITAAVEAARARIGHTVKIEVEVTSLDELAELLTVGADIVLLDNMSTEEMAQAVATIAGRMITEASGGITLETVRAIAATGVDVISVGWITHSAPNLDVALDFITERD